MRELVAGERVAVGETLSLTVDLTVRPPLGLALIGLTAARRASPDFPPLDTMTRELRPAARFEEDGTLHLQLAEVPASVERLALAAFLVTGPGGGIAFRRYESIALKAEAMRFRIDLVDRADTALLLAEIYRYAGGWRLAANGGGFVHGLPALADTLGVDPSWARRLTGAGDGGGRGRDHDDDDRPRGPSSGSGVAVDAHHVLSNAHVVEDARQISVSCDGRMLPADLVFADPRNDLALLRVADALPATIGFREGLDLHLGEEVVALGYPLQGLLGSGPQASGGNIAGLCGIGNDSTLFQFTAPIASGNSGGPILDGSGQLIGLVCSSLNLDRVRAAGSNAENVNFGIKGAVVRSFLDAFGVQPRLAAPAPPMARSLMVREARPSLHRVTCQC